MFYGYFHYLKMIVKNNKSKKLNKLNPIIEFTKQYIESKIK